MKQENYHASMTVDASVQEAFEKITEVSSWWTNNFEGSAEKQNDIFTITFGETFATFKLTEVVPNKKIVWLTIDCNLHWLKDKKEWKDTTIVWEVSTENGKTKIDMTHIGLVPGIECFDNCNEGWNHYIKESLFKLLTEEKGLPEKEKETTMVN